MPPDHYKWHLKFRYDPLDICSAIANLPKMCWWASMGIILGNEIKGLFCYTCSLSKSLFYSSPGNIFVVKDNSFMNLTIIVRVGQEILIDIYFYSKQIIYI